MVKSQCLVSAAGPYISLALAYVECGHLLGARESVHVIAGTEESSENV